MMALERQSLRTSSKSPADFIRQVLQDEIPPSRFESMTDEDIAIQSIGANVNLALFDNNYFQYQIGLMAVESWQAQCRRFKDALQRNDFMRAELAARPHRYRDSFLVLAREIIAELDNSTSLGSL